MNHYLECIDIKHGASLVQEYLKVFKWRS